MSHHKAFKFRLYPTKAQADLINRTIGCTRFVFNHFLAQQKKKEAYWHMTEEMVQNGQLPMNNWKSGFFQKFTSIKELPELKKQAPFLKEVDSIALQKAVENLHDAYERYYKKQNKAPHFKSKRIPVQAYTTKRVNGNIAIDDNKVKLPKLGWIRFSKSREVEGRILNATIRKAPSGKYYISIVAEVDSQPMDPVHKEVGIDLGIKEFAALSDGTKAPNHHFLVRMEQRIAKEQRTLSRRTIGSSNWRKQKIVVARLHEKITNARMDFLHQLSTQVVKTHDLIAIEDLHIANMVKNKTLSKHIRDVGWGEFRRMLTYKAEWYGRKVLVVSPWYASSQLCSACGHQHKETKNLSVRQWTCPECGSLHDRDHNASQNLLNEARRLLTA
ncbi:IS200/IS605 family element RNA-guided endonuclease TnpB [Neobacillus sp. YIM B06451]|uniref:IS200/IS605 family element RNA-guided endonuclease TnpB n=1 Tax=Neobacillus sp. YIM B06451 TaxID=3070994 RepID=UPI00292CC1EE|nr:IS200/IS605 family element RNA-guided endonuclease TnpB [Neobacillus sp. YIM B06451]